VANAVTDAPEVLIVPISEEVLGEAGAGHSCVRADEHKQPLALGGRWTPSLQRSSLNAVTER
jgi:hypothetical protein